MLVLFGGKGVVIIFVDDVVVVVVVVDDFFGVFLLSLCLTEWRRRTVGQNIQESRLKYWVTRSSVRSFARTAHSFTCYGLLASLAPSTALTRSLAHSLHSLPRSWGSK